MMTEKTMKKTDLAALAALILLCVGGGLALGFIFWSEPGPTLVSREDLPTVVPVKTETAPEAYSGPIYERLGEDALNALSDEERPSYYRWLAYEEYKDAVIKDILFFDGSIKKQKRNKRNGDLRLSGDEIKALSEEERQSYYRAMAAGVAFMVDGDALVNELIEEEKVRKKAHEEWKKAREAAREQNETKKAGD
jgi:hypothetical protein